MTEQPEKEPIKDKIQEFAGYFSSDAVDAVSGIVKKGPLSNLPLLGSVLTLGISTLNAFTGNKELSETVKTSIEILDNFNKKLNYMYSIFEKIPANVYNSYYSNSNNNLYDSLVKSIGDLIQKCTELQKEIQENKFSTNAKFILFSDQTHNEISQKTATITSLFLAYCNQHTDLIMKLILVGHRRSDGSIYTLPKDVAFLSPGANAYFGLTGPVQSNYSSMISRMSNTISEKLAPIKQLFMSRTAKIYPSIGGKHRRRSIRKR